MAHTYTYRLAEITYRNRTEWEDGPGSLQNIVSDASEKVVRTWRNMDETFGENLLKDGDPTLVLLPDRPDGWIEHSYRLERRSADDSEWRFVGYLESNRRDEWDTGYYPEDYFDEPNYEPDMEENPEPLDFEDRLYYREYLLRMSREAENAEEAFNAYRTMVTMTRPGSSWGTGLFTEAEVDEAQARVIGLVTDFDEALDLVGGYAFDEEIAGGLFRRCGELACSFRDAQKLFSYCADYPCDERTECLCVLLVHAHTFVDAMNVYACYRGLDDPPEIERRAVDTMARVAGWEDLRLLFKIVPYYHWLRLTWQLIVR